jgi:predicted lipid-binding transport protein (Tim44 family)
MKKTALMVALALSLFSTVAVADERRGSDAALGALSGAVVFGPVGAVAGAVVGFTAGPSIAHSWGFRRSSAARRGRASTTGQAAGVSPVDSQPVPNRQAAPPPAAQAAPPPPKTASTAPPVQSLE